MILRVTSDYGWRFHPIREKWQRHHGLDFGIGQGTPVLSVGPGVVSIVRYDSPTAGHWIEVDHGDGHRSRYMHLSYVRARPGQRVDRGTVIAHSGGAPGTPGAGLSTGPHLHFELRWADQSVDPVPRIDWSPVRLMFKHPDGKYYDARPPALSPPADALAGFQWQGPIPFSDDATGVPVDLNDGGSEHV